MKKHRSWLDPCEGDGLLEEMVHLKTVCQDWGKRLKRLVSYGKSLALLLQVYSQSTWNFWHWRLDLARDPEQLMESTHKHMKQTLLFIRHGQTTWNVEHLLPGQLPGVLLNEAGHAQAERLAEALKILPVTAIISSPLERARDTADYLARVRELPVLIEDDLKDTDVGPWAGKNYNELRKVDAAWKEYVRDPLTAPEGVENFLQVQQRVVAAVERWLKREETGNYAAFVAHADVIKLLLAYYMGFETGRAGLLFIDNASVSIVELEQEQRPHVVAIGWSPRPGWLTPPVHVPAQAEETPAEQSDGSQA
jgi:probable phosphoglycerate mutase